MNILFITPAAVIHDGRVFINHRFRIYQHALVYEKFLPNNLCAVLCVEIFPELFAGNRIAAFVGVNVAVDYAAVVFVAGIAHFVQHVAHRSGAI